MDTQASRTVGGGGCTALAGRSIVVTLTRALSRMRTGAARRADPIQGTRR